MCHTRGSIVLNVKCIACHATRAFKHSKNIYVNCLMFQTKATLSVTFQFCLAKLSLVERIH